MNSSLKSSASSATSSPQAHSPLRKAAPASPLERVMRALKWPLASLLGCAGLWLVFQVFTAGQTWWAMGLLALLASAFYVYLSGIGFAYRYLYPGLAGMLVFVAFPLAYTAFIGFSNYSSSNLLSQDRARAYLLEQTTPDDSHVMRFALHTDGAQYRLALYALDDNGDVGKLRYVSSPLALLRAQPPAKLALQTPPPGLALGPTLSLKEVLRHREVLRALVLALPEPDAGSTGAAASTPDLHYLGVSEFGPLNKVWQAQADGSLTRQQDGISYRPNTDTGFFESASGDRLQPGFKVFAGLKHYTRMVTDPDFRGPFFSIFVWTVMFSGLTVVFTLLIGMALAVLLNWESLRFRTAYRTLLFLPYAVPGFISILVFKGLFNQNFGEINAILGSLFGVKPAWFADPFWARSMLLIVNTWLGYPYIMVLCTGLLKAIPAELYEASAMAGAGPLTNFFKITAPLIAKPLTPLLVGVFAFNFNNFVLIALLTDGRPDYLSTKVPAGQTDILVSYTYRIAFQDSGQDFGLAAAVSTVIFVLVALMSLLNLRLMRANAK